MKILPAIKEDIPNIMNMIDQCIEDMKNQGIYQWNDYYPSLNHIEESIQDKSMYIMKENENPSNTQKCVWGPRNHRFRGRVNRVSPGAENPQKIFDFLGVRKYEVFSKILRIFERTLESFLLPKNSL